MELIVKIDNDSSIDSVARAVQKIKGVISVSRIISSNVSKTPKKLSAGLESLKGSVSFTKEEIDKDPRLAYILSK